MFCVWMWLNEVSSILQIAWMVLLCLSLCNTQIKFYMYCYILWKNSCRQSNETVLSIMLIVRADAMRCFTTRCQHKPGTEALLIPSEPDGCVFFPSCVFAVGLHPLSHSKQHWNGTDSLCTDLNALTLLRERALRLQSWILGGVQYVCIFSGLYNVLADDKHVFLHHFSFKPWWWAGTVKAITITFPAKVRKTSL